MTGYSFGFGVDGGGGVPFPGAAGVGGAADADAEADEALVGAADGGVARAVPDEGCVGVLGVGGGAVSCAAPAWASACPPTADPAFGPAVAAPLTTCAPMTARSEEHTSELQSRGHLVCRLLLEKKNNICRILRDAYTHV